MCKCTQSSDLSIILREAYSLTTEKNKYVVWESKNKEIFHGLESKAKLRLENGSIDCYFIPKKVDGKISFDIIEKSKAKTNSRANNSIPIKRK